MREQTARYRDLLKAPRNTCLPDLYPVAEVEIMEGMRNPSVHRELDHVWKAFGYGFFTHAPDGTRLTESSNRLYPPDEIEEVSAFLIQAYEIDVRALGTPFFEICDYCFYFVGSDGRVVNEAGRFVSEDLTRFFTSLLADPCFADR